jgi:hypothetical protein
MDHAAVFRTNLEDVIPDGNLPLNVCASAHHKPPKPVRSSPDLLYHRNAGRAKKITDITQKNAHDTTA